VTITCLAQDQNPKTDQDKRHSAMSVAANGGAQRRMVDQPVAEQAPERGQDGEHQPHRSNL